MPNELTRELADAAAEYEAVRHGAGLVDRSQHGVVEVTGRDRVKFLHALLSNDIKALAPGQGCAATLLDIHGKVQVVLAVLVLDEAIVLVTPAGMGAATVEHLDKFLFAEKVDLHDVTGEAALVMLAGPRSAALAAEVIGARPAESAWSSATGKFQSSEVRVVRGGGETGEAETWLMAPAAVGDDLRRALLDSGARPVGEAALESLRIEAGTPRYGFDVDDSVLLPEIPFADLLSYSKGCYPGQEVVVRIRDRGHVNRMLRGLVLAGDTVPSRGARVVANSSEASVPNADASASDASTAGADVGRITSAAWSFGLARPIALAFVRRQHAESGTTLRIVSESGATQTATVSALPFAR